MQNGYNHFITFLAICLIFLFIFGVGFSHISNKSLKSCSVPTFFFFLINVYIGLSSSLSLLESLMTSFGFAKGFGLVTGFVFVTDFGFTTGFGLVTGFVFVTDFGFTTGFEDSVSGCKIFSISNGDKSQFQVSLTDSIAHINSAFFTAPPSSESSSVLALTNLI